MLTIIVPEAEGFDESTSEFTSVGGTVLELEHSLLSLSKWESIYEEPFLDTSEKSTEQVLTYVKAMTLTPNVPDELYSKLSSQNFEAINAYIGAKRSATWISELPGAPKSTEKITSELIYYWMSVFNIWKECETWHLNRLLVLIRVCNVKQGKPKKMTPAEVAAHHRKLNEERKKKLGTSG